MRSLLRFYLVVALIAIYALPVKAETTEERFWISVKTPTREERTKLANLGMAIDSVVDDTSYGIVSAKEKAAIEKSGLKVLKALDAELFLRKDYPAEDAEYHNYSELTEALHALADRYPQLVRVFSIGRTPEGRDIWVIRINSDPLENAEVSGKPGIVFMGGHHAREHLSVEVPLKLAQYLLEQGPNTPSVANLLETREIFIIPMVNPDGAEHDIADGRYKMWRKNRAVRSGVRCVGVDLNRNYAFQWGTGGSSTDPCSDVHMGPTPFSEPETIAMKQFIEGRPNLKILLSFHTYSELILYPWGHKYDSIENANDLAIHENMARAMAGWNRYTPQQTSDLYVASGDTTDWSYGSLGIISFTFELSPKNAWGGAGFYPGARAIEPTFRANLQPALYLIDLADDPSRAVRAPQTTLLYGTEMRSRL